MTEALDVAFHLFLDVTRTNGDVNGVAILFYLALAVLCVGAWVERPR